MKQLILFNSYVYTVKSVYRKKLRNSTIKVFLTVLEKDEKFIFNVRDANNYKFLKRGAIITVHLGNGGYICIQEGKKLPENDSVYYSEVEHTNGRIKYRRKYRRKNS